MYEPGVVAYAFNLITLDGRQEEEFKIILNYTAIVRPPPTMGGGWRVSKTQAQSSLYPGTQLASHHISFAPLQSGK